jgi:Tol biopolymer transport system component
MTGIIGCSGEPKISIAPTSAPGLIDTSTYTKEPTLIPFSLTPTVVGSTVTIIPTSTSSRSFPGQIVLRSIGREEYNSGIGLLNFETGNIKNILPGSGVGSLSWSPDGNWIALDTTQGGSIYAYPNIFVVKADGKEFKRLTTDNQSEIDLDWSPDGAFIAYAYEKGAPSELALLQLSDSVSFQLTSTKGHEIAPSFSPDGKTLAYVYVEDFRASMVEARLMLIDIESRQITQLKIDEPVITQKVSWSPDGSTIAFISGNYKDGCGDIYLIKPDGSNLVRLTELSNCATQVVWSPDGNYLAFIGRDKKSDGNIENWGWQIYVIDSQGKNVVQITDEKRWTVHAIDWILPLSTQ